MENRFTKEYAEKLALEKYPESKFWIGSGKAARLYDENKGDRYRFIEGYMEAIKETAAPELLEALNLSVKRLKQLMTHAQLNENQTEILHQEISEMELLIKKATE